MRKLSAYQLVCYVLQNRRKDESVNPDFFVFKFSIIRADFSRANLNGMAENDPKKFLGSFRKNELQHAMNIRRA